MRTHLSSGVLIALVACAVSSGVRRPATSPGTQALFPQTEAAPTGAVLRVFVEPTQVVGWVAGSRSFAGQQATLAITGARKRTIAIGDDNTFAFPIDAPSQIEATVTVGELVQKLTLQPAVPDEAVAWLVSDRNAYRPGQKVAFTGFLRRHDARGEFQPVTASPVEVKITSDTRHTVAAKLSLPVDGTGRIRGDYTFSPSDPLDSYTISIAGYRGAAQVTLAEYRKAKIALAVDAKLADRGADLVFSAKDFLDKPVPGGRVSFTAQVVYEPTDAAGPLDPGGFAYGGHRGLELDEILLHAADPASAGRLWEAARHTVSEVKGEVALDDRGTAHYRLPLESAVVRGHHELLVDAVMLDGAGREQRTTRAIPLSRNEVRLQIVTPHELIASDGPVDVSVRAVDHAGRLVVPASASVAAIRIDPPAPSYTNGYIPIGIPIGQRWVGGPNGGYWVDGPCATNICPEDRISLPALTMQHPVGAPELAATAAVVGDTASLAIDDPGAYRLLASAKLADGSVVWGEAGIAVRERVAMPPLVVELDRTELDRGDSIAGTIHSRYRGAAALVIVRDAAGIKARHRVTLPGGMTRIALPIPEDLGYGAAVEAYVLGASGIEAGQKLFHVAPAKQLAIHTDARPTYGPGDVVDLGIDVERATGPVDLVVSVFDQSLLGTAPDREVDPRSFFLADDRARSSAGLATIAAQLGDLTIEAVLDRARDVAKSKRLQRDPEADRRRAEAEQLLMLYDRDHLAGLYSMVALLRFAGVRAIASGGDSGSFHGVLPHTRVIDELSRAKGLAFERVADAVAIFDPAQLTQRTEQRYIGGYASGNAYLGGSASYQTVVVPGLQPLSVTDSAGDPIRRDFSDSAYWSSAIRTDDAGRARVRFKLPDSLTTWQIRVTAISHDARVGHHVQTLRTTRDVMIWPMLPRQVVEGDVVELGATVHNLTDADRDITVGLETKLLELLTPARFTIRVPRNSTASVTWKVRAGESGVATLLASAVTPGAAPDASLKQIPIAASAADQVITASGFTDHPFTIELPAGVDPRSATLSLTFAPSLAADMVQTLDYLVEYPYGCAEQTMSRFAPAIEVAGVLDNLGIKDSALVERMPRVVAGGFKRLAELQQPDGGWAWQGSGQTHEMITPYVVWGLLRAQAHGYAPTDPAMISRGLERIRSLIDQRGDDQLSDRTYLMYVYSQKHALTQAQWSWLATRAPKLSDYALALALDIAIARGDRTIADAMAASLKSRAIHGDGGTHWRTGGFSRWDDDPFETTAVVLDALIEYDPTDAVLPDVLAYFIANKRGDRWNSTKATAMTLYAMTHYLRARNIATGRASSIDVAVNGRAPHHLAFADGLVRTFTVGGDQLAQRSVVTFSNASSGVMVRASLRYRNRGRELLPMSSGLSVTREVYLLGNNGQPARRLASGDHVARGSYVESVVTVTHHQNMRYLLIEDPKPAGAEALPLGDRRFPRLHAEGYVLREDREAHLAFHYEAAPATTTVHSVLHLESAGDLAFVPASAELMYQTQTRGHAGSFRLVVE